MRRFYSPLKNQPDGNFALDTEQSHHLRKVLRSRSGEQVGVFDGKGNEFLCVIQEFDHDGIAYLRITKQVEPKASESPLQLTLGVALLKGDKFDLVIQKGVEIGVVKLVPIITVRSDVKAKNIEKKLERWQKIIIESSKQCGRAALMEITAPIEFQEFVQTTSGKRILFAEKCGESFSKIRPSNQMTAFIGPEGGWADSEIDIALENSLQVITLGGRILRAETAAISISSLLQHTFGDLN